MDPDQSPTLTGKPRAVLSNCWHPVKVDKPRVDPQLPWLNEIQRSAEVFRYSILSTEYWLSPNGALREWLRLNAKVALILGIPSLLIVPPLTFLLSEFVTWSQLVVEIAKNLAIVPLLAVVGIAIFTCIVFTLRYVLHK